MLVGEMIGSGKQDAELRVLRPRRPDFLTVHHPLVAITHRSGAQTRQIAATLGLGEQLTPERFTRQHVEEVGLLLSIGSGSEQCGTCPPDTDRVVRPSHVRATQFIVHHQLFDWRSIDSPGTWPMWRHVAGAGQLDGAGIRIRPQPPANGLAKRIVVTRKQREDIAHAR